jgi:hypothetical protein
MGETIRCTSEHSEELGDGRSVERGGFAHGVDLSDEINARLLREDRIIRVPEDQAPDPPKLTGAALEARAKALDIEGRGDMSADELRDAIAKKEEEEAQ